MGKGIEEKNSLLWPVYNAGHHNPMKIQWKYRNGRTSGLRRGG